MTEIDHSPKPRDRVIAAAEKYVAKGKIEDAIKVYATLLRDNPNDVNTLNRIGDLFLRINNNKAAVEVFERIASHYFNDGFFLKSIAIYKKILKLDPAFLRGYEILADLYEKVGLHREAATQLEVFANYCDTRKDYPRAAILRHQADEVRRRSETAAPKANATGPDPVAGLPIAGVPIVKSAADMVVFLCHASEDKLAVRALYGKLTEDRFQPWLDEEDLLPGQKWEAEIQRAVRRSHVVIVCLSPRSVTKAGFLQKEIKTALDVLDEQPEGIIFVVPARLEECEVPTVLRHLHYVDLFGERGYEKLKRALHARATQLGMTAR